MALIGIFCIIFEHPLAYICNEFEIVHVSMVRTAVVNIPRFIQTFGIEIFIVPKYLLIHGPDYLMSMGLVLCISHEYHMDITCISDFSYQILLSKFASMVSHRKI